MIGGLVFAAQLVPAQESHIMGADLIEAQLEQDVNDFLTVSTASGELHDAVLFWNESTGSWMDSAAPDAGVRPQSTHPLAVPMASVFHEQGVSYNVNVIYQTASGEAAVQRMFYQGMPGAHGVSGSVTLVLYDDEILTNSEESKSVSNASTFYAPDVFPDSPKYNVIRFQIIAWKS